jgi:hypothetical protein
MAAPAEVATLLLTQTCTVYGRDATTGQFTVSLRTALPCRLLHLNLQAAPTGAGRADLASRRSFCWDPSYTFPALPTQAQIEVDGLRWNLVNTNAIETMRWVDGTACYKRADCVRAA